MAEFLAASPEILSAIGGEEALPGLLGQLGDQPQGLDQFISSLISPQATTAQPSAAGAVLGPVQDRLLTPRAGPATTALGPIQDRLLQPGLLGSMTPPGINFQPGLLGQIGGPQTGLPPQFNMPNLQPPNLFQRQPF